jgi:hypothetical protein
MLPRPGVIAAALPPPLVIAKSLPASNPPVWTPAIEPVVVRIERCRHETTGGCSAANRLPFDCPLRSTNLFRAYKNLN